MPFAYGRVTFSTSSCHAFILSGASGEVKGQNGKRLGLWSWFLGGVSLVYRGSLGWNGGLGGPNLRGGYCSGSRFFLRAISIIMILEVLNSKMETSDGPQKIFWGSGVAGVIFIFWPQIAHPCAIIKFTQKNLKRVVTYTHELPMGHGSQNWFWSFHIGPSGENSDLQFLGH